MGAWRDGVELFLEFSPTTDPLNPTPTWVDISDRMRGRSSIRVFRGKEAEDDDLAPGTMRVTVDNADRAFDPEHAAGPYFGDLKPMRRIRLRAELGAFSTTVFDGFVQRWAQEWNDFDGSAVLDCVDGSRTFRNVPLAASAYEAAVLADNPIHYFPAQNGVAQNADLITGLVIEPTDPATFGSPYSPQPVDLGLPLDQPAGVFDTKLAVVQSPSAQPVAIEGWVNVTAATTYLRLAGNVGGGANKSGISLEFNIELVGGSFTVFTIPRVVYYNPAASRYWNTSPTSAKPAPFPLGVHHVAAYADASNVYIMLDGEVWWSAALSVGTVATADAAEISMFDVDGESTNKVGGVSHLAIYSTAPSQARFKAHWQAGRLAHGIGADDTTGVRIGRILDEVGWPSARRSIDTGSTVVGRYQPANRDAMTEIRDLERTEAGLFFFDIDGDATFIDRQHLWLNADTGVVFSDDATAIAGGAVEFARLDPDGNDINTVRNVITVLYADDRQVRRRDQTSITESTASSDSLSCAPIPRADTAANRAAYELRQRKDPGTVFPVVEVDIRPNTATQFPAVLGLDIGTVVTVERTPMNVGSAISRKAIVLGIEHEIESDQWTTRFYLSRPVTTAATAGYLTLGNATRGKLGTTAGNVMPY